MYRAALAFFSLSALALAQNAPPRSTVRATGSGEVSVKPDQAQIDVGVVTIAPNAQDAAAANAKQLNATLNQLKKAVPRADLKTVNYALTPNYRYDRAGGSPTLTGYQATNTIQVKLDDVTAVGKVIDTAAQAGSNQIQHIQFTVQDETKVRSEALGLAAKQAKANAEGMAAALGLKVLRVLHVEEGQAPIRPLMMEAMRAGDAKTPVQPGSLDVRATVTVTIEAGP